LNYNDHAAETGQASPKEPILFTKATSCIGGPNDPITLPRNSVKTDWEVDLGVVISDTAHYVTEAEALKYVARYCLINDVSEREYQMERGGTWDKGKGCDTFGPIGPYLVTADEIWRSAEFRHVARRERRARPNGQYAHHDFLGAGASRLRAFHVVDKSAGRFFESVTAV
jgi:2-keto-4-pentenoate hydratase/2-oxohepta-3-ene-1,7-dioic acid hydratase in catechol pathway